MLYLCDINLAETSESIDPAYFGLVTASGTLERRKMKSLGNFGAQNRGIEFEERGLINISCRAHHPCDILRCEGRIISIDGNVFAESNLNLRMCAELDRTLRIAPRAVV